MDWTTVAFDWNHARTFLAIAETGSLSAAARALKQTQPTMGRQLNALESELGLVLFERVGRGLELTPTGKSLAQHVGAMRDAAAHVSMAASGRSDLIEGPIAITASDISSAYLLPPIFAELTKLAPKLHINIIAANDLRDLLRREADIAIRHVRPTEPELIARLVANASGRLVCAQSYIDRCGTPTDIADLSNHEFISFGDPQQTIDYLHNMDIHLTKQNFKIRCDNGVVSWEMVRAGMGLAFMDSRVIEKFPDLVHALPDLAPIEYPIWLTTHRELHTSQKIRLVYDLLAKMIPDAMGERRD
jgi:DNA-binding transcriptional LysR family regulator